MPAILQSQAIGNYVEDETDLLITDPRAVGEIQPLDRPGVQHVRTVGGRIQEPDQPHHCVQQARVQRAHVNRLHLAGDAGRKGGGVEQRDGPDAALASDERAPGLLHPDPDGRDQPQPGDDDATPVHLLLTFRESSLVLRQAQHERDCEATAPGKRVRSP